MPPESLRETLIAAALRLLEEGDEEVGLRAVARAAGVSAMAPYRHFADKTALFAAVSGRGFAMLHAALSAADSHPDPREALLAQGLAYRAFARAHPALFRLMFSDPLGHPTPDSARPADHGAYGVLAARVAQLVPERAEAATLACWSIVHGLAVLELDGRLPGLDEAGAESALRLFVTALAEGRPR